MKIDKSFIFFMNELDMLSDSLTKYASSDGTDKPYYRIELKEMSIDNKRFKFRFVFERDFRVVLSREYDYFAVKDWLEYAHVSLSDFLSECITYVTDQIRAIDGLALVHTYDTIGLDGELTAATTA